MEKSKLETSETNTYTLNPELLNLPPKVWRGTTDKKITNKETQLDRIENKLDLVIELLGEK